jgi:hypothetical protein
MEIGRSVPRHQQIALLYSRSQRLQASVLEYYILVVHFCHNLFTFTQRSTLRQFTSTLSDATIRTTQSDLSSKARDIEDELRVLMAQRIETEAEENSRFRSLTTKFSRTVTSRQMIAAELRILEKCSTHDHETAWKQIRKTGNTTLFSQTAEFVKWRSQTQSCTLLYLGKLGCGKSVMLANIVDDLNLFIGNEDASVVYFFVQHDLPISLKARTIVGSIVRQLLRSNRNLTTSTGFKMESFHINDMLSLLRGAIPPQHKIYLILDGLNLCSLAARMEVTKFIQQLQEQAIVLTCVSYRQEPNVELDTAIQHLQLCEAVSMPENTLDIEAFIEAELSFRLESRSLNLGDASLIVEIQDALLEGSKGMFLWVVLQINSLCTMQTDDEIRQALENLPEDLSTVYAQLLKRQQGPIIKYQRRIFELIMAAQRPLTTNEMREALSVTPGETVWTATKLINDVYAALATCGCLIIIEEEELTVRFVHPTVELFLLGRYSESMRNDLTMETCQKIMAEISVTYLSYEVFGTAVSTYLVPKIKVGSAPANIVSSTMQSSPGTQSLALKFLRRRKQADFDIGRILAEETKSDQRVEAQEFHFQHYARPYYLQHVSKVHEYGPHIPKLLCSLVEKADPSAKDTANLGLAFEVAIEEDNVAMASILLSTSRAARDAYNMKLPGNPLHTIISLAVCKGQERMLELFVRTGDWTLGHEIKSSSIYTLPICYIAYFSRDTEYLENLFVAENTNKFQHVCACGRNLLACAVWGRNMTAINIMLNSGLVDVNGGGGTVTPIQEAVRTGNGPAFELILSSNQVCLTSVERTALYAEARSLGHIDIQTKLDRVNPHETCGPLLLRADHRMRTLAWKEWMNTKA